MIARLLGAIQFLTIVPVRRKTAPPGECAVFFPLIGAALGSAGGLLLLYAGYASVPRPVAALLVLGFWAVLTGGLHEDGLADVADAFRAGRSRERILAILKDSRIGAHGALAWILITLLRWQMLAAMAAEPVRALTATLAVSRASLAGLAWISAPVGGGLGFEFSRSLTTTAVIAAIVQAIAWSCFSGAGTLLIWGASIIVMGSSVYYNRRIGGVTGDCLGATCLLVETWGLALFSCQRCM
jgi:adenosylcobinamide-GDP ribazoletransferase